MKTFGELETSVNKLIRVAASLREERDGARREAGRIRIQLDEALRTIQELEIDIEKLGRPEERLHELDQMKSEIIERLQAVVNRLDSCIDLDIEKTTNEQD